MLYESNNLFISSRAFDQSVVKKKYKQHHQITADTSAIDSMNANSTSQDTTGTTSRNPNDSVATIKMKDSAGGSSK